MLTLLSEKLSPRESGIVIAGYGEKEFFPSLVEYGTDGLVGNRLKVIKKGEVDVSREQPSCIRAFAQSDMVQRFMNGCDSALFESLIYGFHDVLKAGVFSVLDSEGVWEGVSEGEKLAKSAAIETRIQEALQAFVSDCESHLDTNYSQPIIQMIGLLPKEELAGLAESLVSLTSLKRRVSAEQETVGGPIDVALISKRDGVVWIKRKHYFDAELNHHFFKNYFDASMEA
ncbi:hypothetical protein A3711_09915 [Erythrobacter sp. HI00D59]|nr:hypothetical protein A3711_09915 [Erythrobacter sp. HI00D59]